MGNNKNSSKPGKLDRKVVLVTRKTRIDELIQRFNTISQARFYLEHLGADFNDYQTEHEDYYSGKDQVKSLISKEFRVQVLERTFLPNFHFDPTDIIVTFGQDGLVANTLKYLRGQPVIGINPDRQRWDGVLLPFDKSNFLENLLLTAKGEAKIHPITLGEVKLKDGQTLFAVNDFFVGQKTHTSARYEIHHKGIAEKHSSSGIIISTGLGSTGWFKSVLAGAGGLTGQLKKKPKNEEVKLREPFKWESEFLYYSVREPFPSNTTGTNLVFGKITPKAPLVLKSMMPENGVIFSDGVESDFLIFQSGMEATITLAHHRGHLVMSN